MEHGCLECVKLRSGVPDCCERQSLTPCVYLLCQITNLDYDEHKGRISIGRISSGAINRAQQVAYLKPGELSGQVTHSRRSMQESAWDNAAGGVAALRDAASAALPAAVCWQPSHLAESQVISPMAYPKVHEERSGTLSLGACRVLCPYRQLKLPAVSRNLRAALHCRG